MGESKGGPPGLGAHTVRLDRKGEPVHPEDRVPPPDPGEAHAAAVLDAAKKAEAVPRDVQTEVEEVETSFEQMKMAEDAEFMKQYQDLDVNELVVTGRVSHTTKVAGQEFVMRTLTDAESEAIEEELSSMINSAKSMAQTHVAALIRRHVLARALVSMNGESLGETPSDRYTRLSSMAMPILLLLHEEYRSLNKAIAILLTGSSGNSLERLLIGPERL